MRHHAGPALGRGLLIGELVLARPLHSSDFNKRIDSLHISITPELKEFGRRFRFVD